nr:class I SAM-dependent methyltransferase [Salinirubrum litoreum]
MTRWVRQPPAGPNVQYLRDAERLAALDQLGHREHVLDVASESTVTAGLDADRVTRLDFSPDARDYARETLGDRVDRYEWVDPGDPTLPFETDEFDAAVSIGPFDWKFLDVDRLAAELARATTGLVVVSVPTPRSPYATRYHNRFRYVSPEQALDLLSPDFRIVDYDLLFQYPGRVHYLLNHLPDRLQEPFVDLAWWCSDQLTDRGRWHDASYLVFGAEPMPFDRRLREGLDCLFRPTSRDGFWHAGDERIVRALTYEVRGDPDSSEYGGSREGGHGRESRRGRGPLPLDWSVEDTTQWRYAPFALLGAMHWRDSSLGTDEYDLQLRAELDYFARQVADDATLAEMPSYGVGPLIDAFARASRVFGSAGETGEYLATAWRLSRHATAAFDFSHAEDCLLPFGWATLWDVTESGADAVSNADREALLADIEDALWQITDRVSWEGLFAFDNGTTRRHQNQMYALWGLCRAIRVTGRSGYLDTVERVLDYTIEHRMRSDGAFLWEDVGPARRAKRDLLRRFGWRPPYWDFLYECHQTFFVDAVAEYYAAGGERSYDREVRRAMGWIFGDNQFGVDLTALSGIGVPMRQLTVDGRIDVPDQQFKGSYEVGAYLLALTNLLAGPV